MLFVSYFLKKFNHIVVLIIFESKRSVLAEVISCCACAERGHGVHASPRECNWIAAGERARRVIPLTTKRRVGGGQTFQNRTFKPFETS